MPLAAAGVQVAEAYLELGAALAVLALAARLARRVELSPIAFYLLGGIALGAIDAPQLTAGFVELTANLGVVLLLFLLGLEYTPAELRANPRAHAPAGAVDAVLNFLPGFAAGLLLGWGVPGGGRPRWGDVGALLVGGGALAASRRSASVGMLRASKRCAVPGAASKLTFTSFSRPAYFRTKRLPVAPYLCSSLASRRWSGGGRAWWVVWVLCARAPSLISVRGPGWLRIGDMMVDGVSRDAVRLLCL